jgi:hypothetical protein
MHNSKSNLSFVYQRRSGLSLIEVLIGLTVTLIVLGAMAGAFRFASQEMAKGRASLELTNRLRSVENLLREDLRRLTVELKSYHRLPASPEGYAEIVDGNGTDARNDILAGFGNAESVNNLLVGDFDDLFAGTIRSDGRPFRGRRGNGLEESHLAEVAWFTAYIDDDGDGTIEPDEGELLRLYRRQLLVKPSLGLLAQNLTAAEVNRFVQLNDISVRVEEDPGNAGRLRVEANSLQELSIRGNRFAHINRPIPHECNFRPAFLIDGLRGENSDIANFVHRRTSDQSDLLLNDLAAFDIRVFAPDAFSQYRFANSAEAPSEVFDLALPTDIGIRIGAGGNFAYDALFAPGGGFGSENPVPRNRIGAYVDLGKDLNPNISGLLQRRPAPTDRLVNGGTQIRDALVYIQNVFDTGTSFYDSDPNSNPFGANGIDDGSSVMGNNIVDVDERFVPPYATTIRGLEFVIRTYEPISGQVSQITVRQSMVPQ